MALGLHLNVCLCVALSLQFNIFLASQDALEVMLFTYLLTYLLTNWVMVSIDLTDVTLVSDDT